MPNDENAFNSSVSEDSDLAGSRQIGLNDSGTCEASDTPPTQRRSPSVRSYAGVTYFVRAGDFIKIGFASNLKDRLGGLQTSHPEELQVLAAPSAADVDEFAMHQKFAHLRGRGEWFRADRELLQFIDYVKAKFGDAAPYKPPPKQTPAPKAPKVDPVISQLHKLRAAHGYNTPIGYRCSNLTEMIPNYRNATDPKQRANLAAGIRGQMADLQRLTSQFN